MKNQRSTLTLIPFFLFMSILPSVLKAEISGKIIAYGCQSCHGERFDRLQFSQTLSATELHQTLLAFKYDKKTATIMNRISKGYTDTELQSVANYITVLRNDN